MFGNRKVCGSGSADWLGIGLYVGSGSADWLGIGLYVGSGSNPWLFSTAYSPLGLTQTAQCSIAAVAMSSGTILIHEKFLYTNCSVTD